MKQVLQIDHKIDHKNSIIRFRAYGDGLMCVVIMICGEQNPFKFHLRIELEDKRLKNGNHIIHIIYLEKNQIRANYLEKF